MHDGMSVVKPQIDLFSGWPHPTLLPAKLISSAAQTVLADSTLYSDALNYGPDPGSDRLREQLAAWLSNYYGTPWTSASRLTVTGGASQGLVSILQVYTDPSYTKNIYMVTPTYFLACRIFEDNGFAGRLRAVPEDDEGIDISYLEACLSKDNLNNGWNLMKPTKRPLESQKHYRNVIYAVPTFSNPRNNVMSLERRRELVRISRKYDALVVTDDVYDFLHWTSENEVKAVIPRLVDIDHTLDDGVDDEFGHVVSNASFSKLIGPGMKTGWTESTPRFAEGLAQSGLNRSGGGPSHFSASVIAEMLRTDALQAYLKGMLLPALRGRHQILFDAMQKYLIPHGVSLFSKDHNEGNSGKIRKASQGGYYMYLCLPSTLDAAEFVRMAQAEENILLINGERFEVSGDENSVPVKHSVRLCVAGEAEELLVPGIERISNLLVRMLH